MKTDLLAIEDNLYRRAAILDAVEGIDFKYYEHWDMYKSCWIVVGNFMWNIDRALKRSMVNLNNDACWNAPEYVTDEMLSNVEFRAQLYKSIDNALMKRLFSLRRIQRRLQE